MKMERKEKGPDFETLDNFDDDLEGLEYSIEIERTVNQDWIVEEMHIQFDEFRKCDLQSSFSTMHSRIKQFLTFFLKLLQSDSEENYQIGFMGLEQLYLITIEILESVKSLCTQQPSVT